VAEANARYEREEDFHNSETSARWNAVGRFYDTAETSLSLYRSLIVAACRDGHVLDYGCGDGELAVLLAETAAHVTGIDISERRIEAARRRGLESAAGPGKLTFHTMNAEHLAFEDDTFDLVCGTSILHHLDLDRALSEIARTLRSTGTAIFLEPLGHNPLINAYRRLTPSFRTEDEHPLLMRDFAVLGRYFGEVEPQFLHLTSLAAVAARPLKIFPHVVRGLDSLDRALFRRVPFLRRYAWIVVLSLRRPRKDAAISPAGGAAASVGGRSAWSA
jgi:ubiquinone/menaquinone biosynthesis C-methylase UbiE